MHVRLCDSDLSKTLISVRKHLGKAVLRNRARRRLRSLCRQLSPDGPQERFLMVSLRDHARDATYPDLRSDLTSAFQFLGLLDP